MLRCFATFGASFGLALPVNTIRLSKAIASVSQSRRNLAGEEGFEPSNAGIKIRCLNQLGDSPSVPLLLHSQGMSHQPLRHESLHRARQLVDHPPRGLALAEGGENACARSRHS